MSNLAVEIDGNTAICTLDGEFDVSSAPELREFLIAAAAYREVILDFSSVTFIDSSGLACVIAGARRVHAANGEIVIAAPKDSIRKMLSTVGVADRLLPVASTIEEAHERLLELREHHFGTSSARAPARRLLS